MMILARMLLGTDSSVMPRQLLQSLSAPFFGILMMTPSAQSAGTSPPSHIAAKSGCWIVAASSGSALSSAVRLSCPGDFPLFRDLIALIISSFSGIAVLMSRSSAASGISASSSGGGLFRISLECSVQRSSYSPSVARRDPCLSLILVLALCLVLSTDELCYFVHSPLLVTFRCIFFLCCKPSIYTRLSALTRRLTRRSASLYCC